MTIFDFLDLTSPGLSTTGAHAQANAAVIRRAGRRQRTRNAQFRRWLESLEQGQQELEFVVTAIAQLLIDRGVFTQEDLAAKILALGTQQARGTKQDDPASAGKNEPQS